MSNTMAKLHEKVSDKTTKYVENQALQTTSSPFFSSSRGVNAAQIFSNSESHGGGGVG